MAKIFDSIKEILVNDLGVDETAIHPAASFIDDLNMDADDLAEFFTSVEDVFSKQDNKKVLIPEADSDNLITVQNLIDYLQDLGIED